jgi:1-acyl-sn-glycerol-3-phosphate acyltransferase
MIWKILRYWTTFIFPASFKRIQIKNAHWAKTDKPAIIAMNHPNSFADPILYTILTHPVRPRFMARGDAFKPGFAAWFLEQIGILPIFRIQDGGKEGLQKNDSTYQKVNQYLKKNHKVIIFAEGLCVLERRLRPIKKGVPRMVFGAYEDVGNDQLQIIPVGLNYSQPDKFGSTVFIQVGEPINIKDYWEDFKVHPAKTYNKLLQVLEPRMKSLVTHINKKEDDTAVLQAEILLKPALMRQKGYSARNLEQDFEVLNTITERINSASEQEPEHLAEFKIKAKAYFSQLEQFKLRDWLFDPSMADKNGTTALFMRLIGFLLGGPLYLLGLLLNWLPFALVPPVTNKLIKSREFYASIALGLGMVFYLIWYIILYFITAAVLPERIWPAFIWLVAGLSAKFCLHFYPLPLKLWAQIRVQFNQPLRAKLMAQRKEVMAVLNKF